jgi:hypothetical protein
MRVKAQEASMNRVSHLEAPPLIFTGVNGGPGRQSRGGVQACRTDL